MKKSFFEHNQQLKTTFLWKTSVISCKDIWRNCRISKSRAPGIQLGRQENEKIDLTSSQLRSCPTSLCFIKRHRICGWKELVKLKIQKKHFDQFDAIESLVQKRSIGVQNIHESIHHRWIQPMQE
jgi:hypothetical protein